MSLTDEIFRLMQHEEPRKDEVKAAFEAQRAEIATLSEMVSKLADQVSEMMAKGDA